MKVNFFHCFNKKGNRILFSTNKRLKFNFDSYISKLFIKEIKKYPQAYEFFQTLNRANLNAIYFKLQTAVKKETRDKRFQTILKTLKERKKFY
jgi:uncharacterized protein YdeI (YjbR/CyaY-like superfamily)